MCLLVQRLTGQPASLGTILSQLALVVFGMLFTAVVAVMLLLGMLVLAFVWLLRAVFARLTGRPVGPWTALAAALWAQWRTRRRFGKADKAGPSFGRGRSTGNRGADNKASTAAAAGISDVTPHPPRGG